jgi:hypothetical protein
MAGVYGADMKAAYARSNTWGTPASVTKQTNLISTEGLDSGPGLVDDEGFNQTFLGEAEVGDFAAIAADLQMQARYEGATAVWIAGAMGSAAPTLVSSQAANSLVAMSHVITLANKPTHFFTLATDFGSPSQYAQEVRTFKVRGFSLRVGDNGRMMVTFPIVADKTSYDSTVNTNSTVGGATAEGLGNRLFRKDATFRMNVQSGGSLVAADALTLARELTFGMNTPLTTDDLVFGQNYIIEPEPDAGYPDFPVEVTFARMNTVTANSMVKGFAAGTAFKADLTYTGPYINSTTQRSAKFEWPALQVYSARASITGHNQVRPVITFRAKQATTAPANMTTTGPLRVTIINANSPNLLV